jgi:phospho-N-acetylmuramoyl-pentapeptide-transferase
MGGVFILGTVALCTLLWADLTSPGVLATLAVLIGYGGIGFVDDWRKISRQNSKGLAGRRKLLCQALVLVATGLGLWWLNPAHAQGLAALGLDTHVNLPLTPTRLFNPDLGFWYLPFAMIIIIGTSNAVNLTDGLDGLAIGPTIVSSATFLVLTYLAGLVLTINGPLGRVDFNVADYLSIAHIDAGGELSVICAAMVGAGLGFLWYNTFPATIFMGDVGSLALGGVLGTMAVLSKNEMLSSIIHGVFLMEALSVITQVASFKLTGKRIFRMAPIHHHFELKGWAEPKIIVRFWLIAIILSLTSLATLKLR